jgi:hypothetical protein
MDNETKLLITRHREAAHQQGIIVGAVCACAGVLLGSLLLRLFGVSCS